jgi:XTP/dITP diphosphohydrolase
MNLIIATCNQHKVKEIKAIWPDLPLSVLSLAETPYKIKLEETGSSFLENAIQKASRVADQVEGFVLADDSGIEVDALDGQPGVFSARYAGPRATDKQNNEKLLTALEGIPWEKRMARYHCVIALIDLQKKVYLSEGICEGMIAFKTSGRRGFGYDPIFYLPEYGATMAQLPLKVKNQISHRAKALSKTRILLDRLLLKLDHVDLKPPITL